MKKSLTALLLLATAPLSQAQENPPKDSSAEDKSHILGFGLAFEVNHLNMGDTRVNAPGLVFSYGF
jgi:hypothetical protein